jgi:hypothetical protein
MNFINDCQVSGASSLLSLITVYFPQWPNICDSVFLVASALYLGCYGIGILGRKPQSSMDSNSVLDTFKALVDDAFRDSP